eukprot:1638511-Lingulodinium_polyedra.AAC.1
MPLHAGPPDVFQIVEDGVYAKVICTMCKVTAALSHCRCKRHKDALSERLAKNKMVHIRWADKYLHE